MMYFYTMESSRELSKSKLKFYKSIKSKKIRNKLGLFLVEGEKIIESALAHHAKIEVIISLTGQELPFETKAPILYANAAQLKQLTSFKHAAPFMAVIQQSVPRTPTKLKGQSIYLDFIQDPGNLGSIIRTCDWFGVQQVLLSPDCVDRYNPKVIQASMGAIFKPFIYTISLDEVVALMHPEQNLYLTDLTGASINSIKISNASSVWCFGNEGNGLRKESLEMNGIRVKFEPDPQAFSESLNVAASVASLMGFLQAQT